MKIPQLLSKISTPADLKKLEVSKLPLLAEEIRKTIIETVLKTGGHLASNLGVVELTLALHYVFNTPHDKIIWDVGHQTYTHKLITGQRERFSTLRQYGGLSGFPEPEKNIYDVFATGHSSTAISAALGLATVRDIKGENYQVIAVVGDGSLTGGLAFEALNHAGDIKKDLIVILNDNEMSIAKNVGALSNYLNKLITKKIYNTVKQDLKKLIRLIPRFGPQVIELIHQVEESLKNLILPGLLFEELGFRYFGPIDGHNIKELISMLRRIKELKGPLLLHVITKKGKGYQPAEENPTFFHSGTSFTSADRPKRTYAQLLGKTLVQLARADKRIVGITAAMREGTGLWTLAEKLPAQFFDVGIAEQHAITFACGLAKGGVKPVVAIYSTFLQRAYDQISHDLCRQNLPVVLAIDKAGITGQDGSSHQGIYDLAYLMHLPNLIIMAPADEDEFVAMLKFALHLNRPVAIRYPGEEPTKREKVPEIKLGKAELVRKGEKICLLALGAMLLPALKTAHRVEEEKKIKITVVNLRFAKPLDEELIFSLASRHKKMVVLEDGVKIGGVGSQILQMLTGKTKSQVEIMGWPDKFIEHGTRKELRRQYRLDEEGIFEQIFK